MGLLDYRSSEKEREIGITADINLALGGGPTHFLSTTWIRAVITVERMIMITCPSGVAVAG